jgi:3',5'-cyclic-AMP phosphodiesterase
MMRLAWLTDIHLDFVEPVDVDPFVKEIADSNPDSVLISGDISTATTIEYHLSLLEKRLRIPIYFVLGNHDYYEGSVGDLRKRVLGICEKSQNLHWLTGNGIIQLTKKTCLIGHDGWADGRFGDYSGSEVLLNDYFLIKEFQLLGIAGLSIEEKYGRLQLMQVLANQAATHFARFLPDALHSFEQIILLTHVPPFREACWHESRISDNDSLPHFSSKVVGDILVKEMMAHAAKKLLVLCGHTHSPGEVDILSNLRVLTGRSTYGSPEVQRFLEIE